MTLMGKRGYYMTAWGSRLKYCINYIDTETSLFLFILKAPKKTDHLNLKVGGISYFVIFIRNSFTLTLRKYLSFT